MPEITLICLKQDKRLKIDETNLHIETWRSLELTHGYGKGANWETIDCFDGKCYNVRSLKSYLEKDPMWDAYDLVEDERIEIEKHICIHILGTSMMRRLFEIFPMIVCIIG